jgi:hypothetical protein
MALGGQFQCSKAEQVSVILLYTCISSLFNEKLYLPLFFFRTRERRAFPSGTCVFALRKDHLSLRILKMQFLFP